MTLNLTWFVFVSLFIVFMTGCAFLKYETKEQALAALEAINGKHKMEVCLHISVTSAGNSS